MLFQKTHKFVATLQPRTEDEIRNEPMLYSCDLDHAYSMGGPITKEFVAGVRSAAGWAGGDLTGYVVDTRVTMLMPGMSPCIGGWHCDGWRREEKKSYDIAAGQPNPKITPVSDSHFVATIGDPPTLWLRDQVEAPIAKDRIWHHVDNYVERAYPDLFTHYPDRSLVSFGSFDLHRGQAATSRGWRIFLRASDAGFTPKNEIRKQVQVYLNPELSGW